MQSKTSSPGIIALMYHRIDETDTDPWDISVSPRHFEEQINFLKNNFSVISAAEAVRRVKEGNIAKTCVCLTFDDGYADNFIHAKPILEKYNCPATFFIPTAFTGVAEPFWWDELEMMFLHSSSLPSRLSIAVAGEQHNHTFSEEKLTEAQWQQHKKWRWYEEPPTARCAAFLSLWEALRPLRFESIKICISELRKWIGNDARFRQQRLPMSAEQLIVLAKCELFSIGLHTHTHPDLQGKEKETQEEEIIRCKNTLRRLYGIDSNCLAYPYGRYDKNTLEAAKTLNLDACFTTEAKRIGNTSEALNLGRFQVCDWNAEAFGKQMTLWMETGY